MRSTWAWALQVYGVVLRDCRLLPHAVSNKAHTSIHIRGLASRAEGARHSPYGRSSCIGHIGRFQDCEKKCRERGSDQKEGGAKGGGRKKVVWRKGEIRLLTVGTISRRLHINGVHLSSLEQSPFLPRHIHIVMIAHPECLQALQNKGSSQFRSNLHLCVFYCL